jgi:hypothetical protein
MKTFLLDSFGLPLPEMAGYDQTAPLEEWQRQLCALVDDRAFQTIETGPVVELYRDQADEAARAMVAGGTLDPATYPMLSELVGVIGADIKAVAEIIWAKSQEAIKKRAKLNGLRVAAKYGIMCATTVEQARSAFNTFLMGLKGLP